MQAPQQAALIELGQCALVGVDLPTLMRQAVELVAHTLEVEYGTILEPLADGSALVLRAGVGWEEGAVGHARVERGLDTPAEYLLLTEMPVIVEDWRRETRFSQPALLRDHDVRSSLLVVIGGRSEPFGILGANSRQGRAFSDDDCDFLQAVANTLAIAIERSRTEESLRASEERYRLLEQRVEERTREIARRHQVAQGLRDILAILNSKRTLDEILDYIVAQACDLLHASAGAIYRLNRDEAMLKIRASRGLDANMAALNLPSDWSPLEHAMAGRQPVAVVDTAADGPQESDRPPGLRPRGRLKQLRDQYRALLAVPLVVKDDVYGAIALFQREARVFSDEEVRLATMLSDQAALAIENARLLAAAQGKAVLDERQRLARDLHDSVIQALYGITLYAEAAGRLLSLGDLATVSDHLRELQDTAQEALQEMRHLIFELRPPVLDQEGLVTALRTRLEAVEGRCNLEARLNVDVESRPPAHVEQALYRVAQEALNNVLKHARAQHVTVSLSQQGSRAVLEVCDDGIGFDVATAYDHGGVGLRGIEERVTQLGGRLIVQTAPGAGTRVRVEVFI